MLVKACWRERFHVETYALRRFGFMVLMAQGEGFAGFAAPVAAAGLTEPRPLPHAGRLDVEQSGNGAESRPDEKG